jgi:hypothetical protein
MSRLEETEGLIAQDEDEVKRQREIKAARRQSTGRGGLGNMAGPIYGLEETEDLIAQAQNEMIQRQREIKAARRQSTGRGGLGNVVTTNPIYRDETEHLIAQNQNEMIQRQRELKAARRHSTGRGGLGNMTGPAFRLEEIEDLASQYESDMMQQNHDLKAARRHSTSFEGPGSMTSHRKGAVIDRSQVANPEYERPTIKRLQEATPDKSKSSGRRGLSNIFHLITRGPKKPSSTSSTHEEGVFFRL